MRISHWSSDVCSSDLSFFSVAGTPRVAAWFSPALADVVAIAHIDKAVLIDLVAELPRVNPREVLAQRLRTAHPSRRLLKSVKILGELLLRLLVGGRAAGGDILLPLLLVHLRFGPAVAFGASGQQNEDCDDEGDSHGTSSSCDCLTFPYERRQRPFNRGFRGTPIDRKSVV